MDLNDLQKKVDWLIEQQRPVCFSCRGTGSRTEDFGRTKLIHPEVCPFCSGTGKDPNWIPDIKMENNV